MYNRSIQPYDIDNFSNAELLELSENAPKVHPDAGVVKLTSGTVAKPSQDMDEDAPDPSEATALDLVFSETTIPVPRVRRVVRRKWDFLVVMDYIDGALCEASDAPRVAAAVQALTTIPAPPEQVQPGPVGGGLINHRFFIDWESSVAYESVGSLQKHFNGVCMHPR